MFKKAFTYFTKQKPSLSKTSKWNFSNRIYNNILETIGDTPIVKINKIAPQNVNIYVKCEYFNPLSSVKDRFAVGVIEDAEKRGVLKPGQTVIEATSGNAGISLAMVCAQKGYPFVATMAEYFSTERRKVMRALGAKVIITPGKDGGVGMVKKAKELSEQNGYFFVRQFENFANADYHAMTTGPEILTAFANKRLDYWVTGYGSGGTFTGAGKVIKQGRPDVKIILSEPISAPLIQSGLKQERDNTGAPLNTHPAFEKHPIPIQGWTPSFVPLIAEDGYEQNIADKVVSINNEDALTYALDLAKYEGIFTGISGGATFAAAMDLSREVEDGSSILAMLPDTMERYLSTSLFDKIDAEMNDEEIRIAETTPNFVLEKAVNA